MTARRAASAAAVLAALAGVVVGPARADGPSMATGRALLAENCGGCHAIGGSGDSPNVEAPPFRVVLRSYPASAIEESLAEGIVTGHPDMPVFVLDPPAIADVVAYLDALAVVTSGD